MSKKGFEIIDHYRSLKRVAIAKKLGVSTKLFESVEDLEEEEELEEMTQYGYDAKQEVGHDAKQGKQKPMQSIDEPSNSVGHRGPKVAKQGPNKHKEENIHEGEDLEEQEELEETTEYGYDAKQEVGHEKKQGKQKPMQKIDTHAKGAGSADPGLRKKGSNKHKEDNMKEAKLNEAVNKLLRTIHKFRNQG